MPEIDKITESPSLYDHLETMYLGELLQSINNEDQKVALAVRKSIPAITTMVEAMVPRFLSGGRLFYIGAGTSGRVGI